MIGNIFWRFYSSAFSFRCFCREQVRFAGDKARFVFRYGKRCGSRCGSSGPDRALGFLQSFSAKGSLLTVFFFIFGFSLFVKWNPKNHYFIFLFPAFFLIRVRKTALLSGFWGRAHAAVTAQAKLKREEQARQSSRQEIAHSVTEANLLTSELTDLLDRKGVCIPRQPHCRLFTRSMTSLNN